MNNSQYFPKIQKGWAFQYHDGEISDEDDTPDEVKNSHGSLFMSSLHFSVGIDA